MHKLLFVSLLIISIICVGFPLSLSLGRNRAKIQKEFYVFKTKEIDGISEAVVLRIYGDRIFAVPINRADKKFEKKLIIMNMSEMSKTPLVLENLGTLTPK